MYANDTNRSTKCQAIFKRRLATRLLCLVPVLGSISMASPVSSRLLLWGLGTVGFCDVTETNGWEFVPVTLPRSV